MEGKATGKCEPKGCQSGFSAYFVITKYFLILQIQYVYIANSFLQHQDIFHT